jgi:UDP-N-acetylmuramate dehydrogenase
MAELKRRLGKRARLDEPMGLHCTWRAGGPAACLARAETLEEAAWIVSAAAQAGAPLLPLGGGSNLLVADGGWPGVVLKLAGEMARMALVEGELEAGGGASLSGAVRLARDKGYSGLEWAAGIPGTLGGAVAMNAGAAGGSMSEVTLTITLLEQGGRVREVPSEQLPAAYRRRELPPGSIVAGAKLKLNPDQPQAVAGRMKEFLERRRSSQPLTARTAGSVFMNPPGDFAGRLIEQAGLKGLAVGGARVSPVHANFIENTGGASAGDLVALMDLVAARVKQVFNVDLEREVRVVGRG